MVTRDTLESLGQNIRDRLTSPLAGAYIISWLIWNYKFVLALFSDLAIRDKLYFIESNFFNSWLDYFLYIGILPVISALLYIFAYPYISRPIYKFAKTKQVEMLNLRLELEGRRAISEDEARELTGRIQEQKTKHQSEVDRLNADIGRLDDLVQKRNNELKDRDTTISGLNKQLSEKSDKNAFSPVHLTADKLETLLKGKQFRLYFNPNLGEKGSKIIVFGEGGNVGGGNENEYEWRLDNNELEFKNKAGEHFSRFVYEPHLRGFTLVRDSRTRPDQFQFIVPESSS